jgi:hypothetical protein
MKRLWGMINYNKLTSQNSPSENDLIKSILYLISTKKGKKLLANSVDIHKVFKDLKDQYPQMFKTISFKITSGRPLSVRLEEIFDDLENANVISYDNPFYKGIEINIATSKNFLEKSFLRYSEPDQKTLEEIAMKAVGLFNVENA